MFRALIAALILALPLSVAPEVPLAITTEILGPVLDPAEVATLKGDLPAKGSD